MNFHDSLESVLSIITKTGKNKFIIVTGGIGDFLSIDYFLLFSLTKNIIFISKQSLLLKEIMNYYYNLNYYSVYFNFDIINKHGFDTSNELINFFPCFNSIKIININEYFPLIIKNINQTNYYKYNNVFFKKKIDVKQKFKLPENYALINPYTEDKRINCINCKFIHTGKQQNCELTRNFIECDYKNILSFLKNINMVGVIISKEPINIKDTHIDHNIINLSNNSLSIIDCIELVKQCNYFFGVDSVFSVIASKLLPRNNIYVKCNNLHGYKNKDIYWYPNININIQSFINIKY